MARCDGIIPTPFAMLVATNAVAVRTITCRNGVAARIFFEEERRAPMSMPKSRRIPA